MRLYLPMDFMKREISKNSVLCGTEDANRNLAVTGAGILGDTFDVVGAVDVHLAAAVGTVEQDSHNLADFEIVVSQTAYVLDDDCLHVPSFHLLPHGGESGAVEPGSGDSIVREMGRVGKSVAAGVIFQHGFLAANGYDYFLFVCVVSYCCTS